MDFDGHSASRRQNDDDVGEPGARSVPGIRQALSCPVPSQVPTAPSVGRVTGHVLQDTEEHRGKVTCPGCGQAGVRPQAVRRQTDPTIASSPARSEEPACTVRDPVSPRLGCSSGKASAGGLDVGCAWLKAPWGLLQRRLRGLTTLLDQI